MRFAHFVGAEDAEGSADESYTETVRFSASDPLACLPADYTLTPADRGFRLFPDGGFFQTPGIQTIDRDTARNQIIGTLTVTVQSLTERLVVDTSFCLIGPCPGWIPGPTSVSAGKPLLIYVAAIDSTTGIDKGYLGQIRFSSSDLAATLPPAYAFAPADQGRKAFTAVLRTPGDQTIELSDDVNGLIPGSLTMTVTDAPGNSFFTIAPCRVVDTRDAPGPFGGPSLFSANDRFFPVGGRCGIPEDARAVAFNFTVVRSTAAGALRIFTHGTPVAPALLSYTSGRARATNATLSLGDGGQIGTHVDQSAGTVDLVIDVTGYFK